MRQVAASVSRRGPCFPASGPLGCAGPQSLVARSALFPSVSPDATWLRGPGGCAWASGQAAPSGGQQLECSGKPKFYPLHNGSATAQGQIRNPKSEIRNNKMQRGKSETSKPGRSGSGCNPPGGWGAGLDDGKMHTTIEVDHSGMRSLSIGSRSGTAARNRSKSSRRPPAASRRR